MATAPSSPTGFTRWAVPQDLETPAVVVDEARMLANVRAMAAELSASNVAFRPHAKTHKCVEVARAQIEAGAIGISTATLSEAEVFARAGITDIFVAYPIWAVGARADRLRRVAALTTLSVGADSTAGVDRIAQATADADARPSIVIEVDSGELRTGVVSPDRAVEIARRARAHGLVVRGVFTHGGHSYRSPDAAGAAAQDEVDNLTASVNALGRAGFTDLVVSAGSTPTARLSARGPVNEERPGTFVFGDRQQSMLGSIDAGDVAAFVAGTVVSREAPGRFILDAGAKSFTKDKPLLLEGFGGLPDHPLARITSLYDHHAVVEIGQDGRAPELGEVVAVVPNHICPVVNLFPELHVLRDGQVVDTWQVATRGCNQ